MYSAPVASIVQHRRIWIVGQNRDPRFVVLVVIFAVAPPLNDSDLLLFVTTQLVVAMH